MLCSSGHRYPRIYDPLFRWKIVSRNNIVVVFDPPEGPKRLRRRLRPPLGERHVIAIYWHSPKRLRDADFGHRVLSEHQLGVSGLRHPSVRK